MTSTTTAVLERGELESVEAIARFLLAGDAYLTVENPLSGGRFTFRFRRAPAREGQAESDAPIFVSVLTGPENSSDYTYLGQLWTSGRPGYTHGAKSRIGPDAPSAKTAAWLCRRVLARSPLAPVRAYHDGRCGRCGRCHRRLTVPESIRSGLGPDCAALLGVA